MARTTIRTEDITAGEVTTAKMATDPTNASNLSSGSVPTAQLGNVNTSGLEDDIALLGFKVASNGSLAKYNLVDQTVDDFQDTSGVDASASTNEGRDASGKYYVGETAVTPTVTGGTITTDGDYKVHSFTAAGSTNYVTDTAQTVDYLLVAGGGGGGGSYGGGGGAGGFRYLTGQSLASGTFAAVVGAKGAGTTTTGDDGTDSSFNSAGATGGGGGGTEYDPGQDGGSGGGASYRLLAGSGNEGGYTPVEGYDGGVGVGSGDYTSGGGGGSSAVGEDAPSGTVGGAGGNGTANSITGASVTYAGGGGGSAQLTSSTGGAGGTGGGGAGGAGANGAAATGEGSGGGGGGTPIKSGGDGSDGIVIVRRPTEDMAEGVNMTLVSTTTAAQAAPTKGDMVFTYTNGAGTTTLGTDVTAEISADGGSTWTAMTLGSEGSTGSHNIATAHDVTISSTITSPWNMAYRIKTLNQTTSKTTRIQAVSLGWS